MSDDLYDRVREGKIKDLIPDDHNANQGTERGDFMLTQSMQKLGAGRSVLLDKNGKLIAGNKTSAKFGEVGLEDVIIVRTNGKQLVAVQRTDLDIDSPEGREMALADNRVSEVNLDWDTDVLAEMAADGVEVGDWFLPDEMAAWDVELPDDADWGDEDEPEEGGGESPGGTGSLKAKFIIPPFSVLDARQGYWQERKRQWLALGIQSELGRGG